MEVTPIGLHNAQDPENPDAVPNQPDDVPTQPVENEGAVSEQKQTPSVDEATNNDAELGSELGVQAADDEAKPDQNDEEDDYEPYEPSQPEEVHGNPPAENLELDKESEPKQESEPNQESEAQQEAESPHEAEAQQDAEPPQETELQQEPQEETSKDIQPEPSQLGKEGLQQPNDENDEDEYDPEAVSLEEKLTPPVENESKPATLPDVPVTNVGLPPKPPTQQPLDAPVDLKEAYEAIMQSDIVKDPLFSKMSQEDQMKTIQRLLQDKNIRLPQVDSQPQDPDMNYDQVYSYNKPFKVIKDPIPLVPIGKYCRRPNIARPMSVAERNEYEAFLAKEALLSPRDIDELPDNLRLFIGNLPANTITKEDLYRIFSQYGEVLQISIKAGYGFVQYRTDEACAESIKGETDVPLHNKYMRLATSKSKKSRASGSRGRERSGDDFGDDRDSKRHRANDCQLLRNEETSGSLFEEVAEAFKRASITYTVVDATGKNIQDEIREAAYLGVVGVCFVKDSAIDLQSFEETPDGGIKFDEYVDVGIDAALNVLNKVKASKPKPQREAHPYDDRRAENSRRGGDRYRGSAYSSRDRGYDDDHNQGRNMSWQNPNRERSQQRQPPRNQWQRPDNRNYNNSPYLRQNNQQFGGPQNFNQDFGPPGGYNQGYPPVNNPGYGPQMHQGPPQGYPNPGYQQNNFQGFNNGPPIPQGPPPQNFPPQQTFNQPQQRADPALLQTLQNLDPATMQNVISLLQQNKGGSPQVSQAQPQYQGYGQSPPVSNNTAQANQVNSMLSTLQSNQNNYNSNQQPSQGQAPSSALMDMLARLGK